jgi:hypothetical protein
MILPDIDVETPQDIIAGQQLRVTPLGEYLGAKSGEGFEMSTPGVMSQETRILAKELDDPRPGYEKQMSREDWEAGPWHREGIVWNDEFTPARAQVYAEDYDARQYRKSLIERSPTGFRSVLGFGAGMVATALDPVNYLSVFGPVAKAKAIMKLGEIGGRAALSAAEAATQTGLTDLAVFHRLNQQGEDLGWLDAALDITFGAAVGGLFGAGGGVLHKRNVESVRRRLPMPMREEFGLAMEKALADQAAGEAVDVSHVLGSWGRKASMVEVLSDIYRSTLENPVGDPHHPFVELRSPEFGEQLNSVIVERGPAYFNQDGEVEITGLGFGLVKVIWKHGEMSDLDLRVAKDDVLALPHVLSTYAPKVDGDGKYNTFAVNRGDGNKVVYVLSKFGTDEKNHLVTIYIEDPKRPDKAPLSQKQTATTEPTPGRLHPSQEGTPDETSYRHHQGREAAVTNKVTPEERLSNPDFRTERPHEIPNEAHHASPATTENLTPEHFEIHPEELEAISRAKESGTMTDVERDMLARADEITEKASKYEEALLASISCLR